MACTRYQKERYKFILIYMITMHPIFSHDIHHADGLLLFTPLSHDTHTIPSDKEKWCCTREVYAHTHPFTHTHTKPHTIPIDKEKRRCTQRCEWISWRWRSCCCRWAAPTWTSRCRPAPSRRSRSPRSSLRNSSTRWKVRVVLRVHA